MSDDYGYFDPRDPSIHALAEQLAEALGVPVGVHDHHLTLHVTIADARRLQNVCKLLERYVREKNSPPSSTDLSRVDL